MRHHSTSFQPDLLEQRFFARIGHVTAMGCIPWPGAALASGYGVVFGGGGRRGGRLAHRVAYAFFVAPIPPGGHVLHRCDNPSCVNPAHLFLGDQQSNNADKVSKGRQCRGQTRPASKLTDEQVRQIRRRHEQGTSQKQLRIEYGVSKSVMSHLINRQAWKHVT